jgi:hypothetical protein
MLLLCGSVGWLVGWLLDAVLSIEALDPSRGIDQALLPSVKRMAIRADFDVQFVYRRASLKCISARAGHYASVIFGMNSSFHLTCPWYPQQEYHPKDKDTIQLVNAPSIRILAAFICFIALSYAVAPAAIAGPNDLPAQAIISPQINPVAPIPAGFAPRDRTEFAPILQLVGPGPQRAERAMAVMDRQLFFQRLTLHPEFSDSLQQLFDKIPPRNSTLIRAATEYSRTDVTWNVQPGGIHQLCVEGFPKDLTFFVTLSPPCPKPHDLFHLGAYFALKPPPGTQASGSPSSVIGTFGGEVVTDTFGFGAVVDAVAQMFGETYGSLQPPWDTKPGEFNNHDAASVQRFRRDLATLDDKFHEYLHYDNILDEFDGPGGPYVLFNFSAHIKTDALKKYSNLLKFYEEVAPTLTTQMDLVDGNGNYWMRTGFDRGRIWTIFLIRDGKLSAFDANDHPVGEPIAIQSLRHGINRSRTSAHVQRLAMDFGLDNLNFTNYYTRDASTVSFEARMDAVPIVIAPVGIQQGAQLVAGDFMRTIAQGSGGMHSQVSSKLTSDRVVDYSSAVSAEFMYSPTLEFFAKLGDSIAEENNEKVRQEERSLAEEFLDAFVKDYTRARPKILALDQDPALAK